MKISARFWSAAALRRYRITGQHSKAAEGRRTPRRYRGINLR